MTDLESLEVTKEEAVNNVTTGHMVRQANGSQGLSGPCDSALTNSRSLLRPRSKEV